MTPSDPVCGWPASGTGPGLVDDGLDGVDAQSINVMLDVSVGELGVSLAGLSESRD